MGIKATGMPCVVARAMGDELTIRGMVCLPQHCRLMDAKQYAKQLVAFQWPAISNGGGETQLHNQEGQHGRQHSWPIKTIVAVAMTNSLESQVMLESLVHYECRAY